ncbi:MAG: aldo/keto reductase [Caldilineaceae bacterium]|nr:aldo/keto reductase [Caldilineaceae bacterium]
MQKTTLGRTGLEISRLGVGLAEIGFELSFDQQQEASDVLNNALDAGINFLDTAACYGISEELIGRTIAHRREEYVLATKCGHVAGDYEGEAWSAQTISDSIDRSLVRMKTDRVDLVQLHSCGVDVLEEGEAIEALLAAQKAGKTRFVGYSGDNEAAAWAVESGIFDTLQTSFNLVEQRARTRLFDKAKAQKMGIIVKRPIANGAWGVARSPSGYADEYFRRAQVMAKEGPIPGAPDSRILLALGFTFAHPEVNTAIVGTRNPAHMRSNIDWVENALPIDPEAVAELHRRFDRLGGDWEQKG